MSASSEAWRGVSFITRGRRIRLFPARLGQLHGPPVHHSRGHSGVRIHRGTRERHKVCARPHLHATEVSREGALPAALLCPDQLSAALLQNSQTDVRHSAFYKMGDSFFYSGDVVGWQNVTTTYNLPLATPTSGRRRQMVELVNTRYTGTFTILGVKTHAAAVLLLTMSASLTAPRPLAFPPADSASTTLVDNSMLTTRCSPCRVNGTGA